MYALCILRRTVFIYTFRFLVIARLTILSISEQFSSSNGETCSYQNVEYKAANSSG